MLKKDPPIARFAVVGLLIITLATLPPLSRIYLAELCSHFRVQMLVVGIILCLFAWRDREPIHKRVPRISWRIFALVPVAIHALFIVGWFVPSISSGSAAQPIRLLVANVHTSNVEHDKLIELIEREQPDVIALLEVDQRWLSALTPLHEAYPFRREVPRSDNFGITVFSRLYIIHNEILSLGTETPAIEVGLWSDEKREIRIVAAHTYPPIGKQLMKIRNRQLEALGKRMANIDRPCVLAGDLNVSMFSPYYADLEEVSGLQNARRGFGIRPTWPTRRPWMMIPIDHCLHSRDVEIKNCRVGSNIGSDHLPLIVDLAY